jgi:chromosome segregation ATPase
MVQSQLSTIMQAYEDAKESEGETSQRLTQMSAVIDAQKNELSMLHQQDEELSRQLTVANSQMSRLLNPTKFFESACRACKAKFVEAFRSELIRAKVDVENLSFMDPKASVDPRSQSRDTCRCCVM